MKFLLLASLCFAGLSEAKDNDLFVETSDNPLADHKITCEEMEAAPELVFKSIDLGSGYRSPTQVNYRCPKSLNQLDFLDDLIKSAGEIREPNRLPELCRGSISHAHLRGFHFSLAKHGYYPQGFSSRTNNNLSNKYFEEWSYYSLYNRKIYIRYMEEVDRARPLLSEWYEQNHKIDKKTAELYTDNAIKRISDWGFGSYYSDWNPEYLVPHTEKALEGNHQEFIDSLNRSTREQKLNSLRRLLAHDIDIKVVEQVIDTIKNKKLKKRTETPLSNAVINPRLVKLLLDKGFDPNHQNVFGKTALFYAIQFSAHDSVKTLLTNGADVNHVYQPENLEDWRWKCSLIKQWGRSPLMHAAQHSDIKMIKLLLSNGANSHDKDVFGSGPLEYALNNGKAENAQFIARNDRGRAYPTN